MSRRNPSRVALAILDHLVADDEPLKGDLLEEFESGRSQWWFWRQVIGLLFCRRRPTSPHLPQDAETFLVGAAVLVLLSFEAVLVTNVMHRLAFGPPLPNISGYLYLLQGRMPGAPASDAMRAPLALR
jgi:hypothetical protein